MSWENPRTNSVITMQSATSQDNALVDFHMTPGAETRGGEDRSMIESYDGAEAFEPYEGLEFDTEEAARVFYNAYARRAGFGSRIGKNLRSRKDGRTIARRFVCSKEGFRAKKHANNVNRVKRPRAITREGCEAMMMVKKTEIGKWVVSKFIKDHNHPLLSPSEVMLLRSHRNASDTPKSRIKVSDVGRMDASKTMSIFGVEASGLTTIEFTEQDYGNHHQMGPKRKRNLGRDIESILEHFRRLQSENPAFYYTIKVDEGRGLCSMFWADAKSRMACNYFGDVVYFDTIYKMNQYEMLFAIFTGVNHHQQSTVFGCALLLDETESTYTWLFSTWLEAMSGHHPVSIITDPDSGIGGAIAQVFPETHHIFNKWHILSNAPKQLSHVYVAFPTFQAELEKCVNLTETVDEFESCWESLVYRYELRENEWLQLLYNARQKWIPVYLQGTFFAQMPITVRSDVVNSFFDWYVNASTTLQEFIIQYERALETLYEKEVEEDVQTMHSKPELKTRLPIEKQVAGIYTRKMFLKFQEEIFESLGYVVNKVKEDGVIVMYRVAKYEDQKRAHTVTFDGSERRASCSCHMFEFLGILCRHVLKVFTISNVSTLPQPYILERWTRSAKSRDVLDKRGVAIQANSRESVNLRYNNLCKQAIKLVEEGAACGENYDVALHALRGAWEKIVSSREKLERVAQLSAPVTVTNQAEMIPTQCEADDTTNSMSLYDPRQLQSWRL